MTVANTIAIVHDYCLGDHELITIVIASHTDILEMDQIS